MRHSELLTTLKEGVNVIVGEEGAGSGLMMDLSKAKVWVNSAKEVTENNT